MDDALRIAVQWLHVLAGVVWIGAGYYVTFVQLPALASMPLAARGPALMALGPRQVRWILRAGEITIASGVANLLLSGRARQLEDVFGSRWRRNIVLFSLNEGTRPEQVHAIDLTHAFISEFDDRDAYRAYDAHAEHNGIRRELPAPIVERLERFQQTG